MMAEVERHKDDHEARYPEPPTPWERGRWLTVLVRASAVICVLAILLTVTISVAFVTIAILSWLLMKSWQIERDGGWVREERPPWRWYQP